MLETLYLTKSKIRGKLLGLLFSNLGKQFYLSELAREVGTSPGNIQREIEKFIQDSLVSQEKKGNMVFYHLNSNHALFNELQSLIIKTTGIEGELRALVKKLKDVQLAILYGSFARGEEHGESDIDFLVVSDGETKGLYSGIRKLESRFDREINPTVYGTSEFQKKLIKKGGFLTDILDRPHRILKGSLDEFKKASPRRTRKKN